MPVKPIPDGYHTVTPYLVVDDPMALITFATRVFGAETKELHRRPDGAVMHAEIRIGDSIVMVGGANAQHPAEP